MRQSSSTRVAGVRDHLPMLEHVLIIGQEYEAALAVQSPERDFGPRSEDDLYILYTGGTTGMPKGVVWRHKDVLMALGGGIDIRTGHVMTDPAEFIAKGSAFAMTSLPTMPLMHGAAQWSVMGGSFTGNRIVLMDKFDAVKVWELIAHEKVNLLMITGDAMARPMMDELKANPGKHDTSSMFAMSSTAALFSQSLKDAFLEHVAQHHDHRLGWFERKWCQRDERGHQGRAGAGRANHYSAQRGSGPRR